MIKHYWTPNKKWQQRAAGFEPLTSNSEVPFFLHPVRFVDLHQAERPRLEGDEHPEQVEAFELPRSEQFERPQRRQQLFDDFVRTSDREEAKEAESSEAEKVEWANQDIGVQARLR